MIINKSWILIILHHQSRSHLYCDLNLQNFSPVNKTVARSSYQLPRVCLSVCPPAWNIPASTDLFSVRFYLYYIFVLVFSTTLYVQQLMRFVTGHLLPGESGGGSIRDQWRTESKKHFFLKILTFSAVIVLLVLLTRSVIIIENNSRSPMRLFKEHSITLKFG